MSGPRSWTVGQIRNQIGVPSGRERFGQGLFVWVWNGRGNLDHIIDINGYVWAGMFEVKWTSSPLNHALRRTADHNVVKARVRVLD